MDGFDCEEGLACLEDGLAGLLGYRFMEMVKIVLKKIINYSLNSVEVIDQ